jgi:uncharacterized membrane protein YgdD (TMEM256/DUF423 family)
MKALAIFAALNGALAVMAGAFAAHGLDPVSNAARIGWLKTASSYQLAHVLALLFATEIKAPLRVTAGFAAGIALFCYSLYAMALGGPLWLGAVTPLGGLAFIFGWLALAFYLAKRNSAG